MRFAMLSLVLLAGCADADPVDGLGGTDEALGSGTNGAPGDGSSDETGDPIPRGTDCEIDRDLSEIDVAALFDSGYNKIFDSEEHLERYLGIRDDECNHDWTIWGKPNSCLHGYCVPVPAGATTYPCTPYSTKECDGACYQFKFKLAGTGGVTDTRAICG